MSSKHNFEDMLKRYRAGEATEEEKGIVESWYLAEAAKKPPPDVTEDVLREDLLRMQTVLPARPSALRRLRPVLAAASVLLLVALGAYFFSMHEQEKPVPASAVVLQHDALPGGKKATLTLSDNRQIVLDEHAPGEVASETGISVTKNDEGQLVYTAGSGEGKGFHTISTPMGGECQVTLSDGSRVWLNASSSIRFPVHFSGAERPVEIAGEVYLEVAPMAGKPFRVTGGGQVVEVLGTRFNINAYPGVGKVKTTLLEGAVKVSTAGGSGARVLKPGQQAILEGNSIRVGAADEESAVAWKNGYFLFDDAELAYIMDELCRWYNVNAVYEGVNPSMRFGGTVSRKKKLSEALRILELSGNIRFKIEGRTITVMPQY